MTGTEPHAPRVAAGSGPRRSCTALYEAAAPAVGPTGTTGRAQTTEATRQHMHIRDRHRRPLDPSGTVGHERAGGAARLGAGATRRRMHISAPPGRAGHGTLWDPQAASWLEELRDSEWTSGILYTWTGLGKRVP
jgi:hypothetical protein